MLTFTEFNDKYIFCLLSFNQIDDINYRITDVGFVSPVWLHLYCILTFLLANVNM